MNDNQNQPQQPLDPNQQPQQPYYPPQNPQAQYQPPYPQQPPQKKKGKGCLIAVIIVVVILVGLVAIGVGGSSKSSNTSKPTSGGGTVSNSTSGSVSTEIPTGTGEGVLGDNYIKIVGAEYSTDYQGNKCVVVTYEWTNNGDEGTSFFVAVNAKVFQNGIQSDYAVVSGLDSKDTTEIKPGATLTVQKAYALQDETSQIEVECEELISFDDEVVSATYQQPLA